ncbi:MAG TPA: helix-turn-helix transcriptional regulator [Spirochaetota bacterium]|nr:helix-turn-helix transcriptional regulator [Spirochaetota bacterium]HOL57231.1 helix-turn-helix transcriptional regulator [Spirochaetota bacterium]HPP05067.1 helix-turn-helix transcriptional regulator [Spirochaetota bacterium]
MIFFYIIGSIFLILSLYHFILWFFRKEDFFLVGFSIYNIGIVILDFIREILPVYNNNRIIYDSGSCVGVLLMSLGLIIFTYIGFDLKHRIELKIIFLIYLSLFISFITTLLVRLLFGIDYLNPIFYSITIILCLLYFILLIVRFIKNRLYLNIDNLIIIIGTTFLIVIATFYSFISILNKRSSAYFFYLFMLIGSGIYTISIILKFKREYNELLSLKSKFQNQMNYFDKFLEQKDFSLEEKNIVRLIFEGKSNKEIGQILNIKSEGTVKSKISKIFRKCNVSSRVELLNLFINSKM